MNTFKSPVQLINHFISEKHKGKKISLTVTTLSPLLMSDRDSQLSLVPANTSLKVDKVTRNKLKLIHTTKSVWVPVTSNRIAISIR